jgi:hypothetical protein
MSDISQLFHGQLSLTAFVEKEIDRVKAVIGQPLTAGAVDGAADQIETVKATVELALGAFLSSKGVAGAVVTSLVDGLLNNIVSTLEGAAHAAAGASSAN